MHAMLLSNGGLLRGVLLIGLRATLPTPLLWLKPTGRSSSANGFSSRFGNLQGRTKNHKWNRWAWRTLRQQSASKGLSVGKHTPSETTPPMRLTCRHCQLDRKHFSITTYRAADLPHKPTHFCHVARMHANLTQRLRALTHGEQPLHPLRIYMDLARQSHGAEFGDGQPRKMHRPIPLTGLQPWGAAFSDAIAEIAECGLGASIEIWGVVHPFMWLQIRVANLWLQNWCIDAANFMVFFHIGSLPLVETIACNKKSLPQNEESQDRKPWQNNKGPLSAGK